MNLNLKCSCIIPFYNEGNHVLSVIEEVTKVRNINQVICVDDGSSDNTAEQIKKRFPSVIVAKFKHTKGKAEAIREGLKHVSNGYVLLMDSDLTNIKTGELERAISKITHTPDMDMVILRRVEDNSAVGWTRDDIIFSGQRILKKKDLDSVFSKPVTGYQLEVAINDYMVRNKKNVFWMPFSIHNPPKFHKLGTIAGLKRGYKMFSEMIKYVGWRSFLWQTFFFCREEAK